MTGANDPGGGVSGTDLIQGSNNFKPHRARRFRPRFSSRLQPGAADSIRFSYTAKVTQLATSSSSLGGANGFQVSYADMNDLHGIG